VFADGCLQRVGPPEGNVVAAYATANSQLTLTTVCQQGTLPLSGAYAYTATETTILLQSGNIDILTVMTLTKQ
jgi:hypothetical protein